MSVLERFRLGWESQLGTVFLALIVVLGVLFSIYWFLVLRLKRRDLLAYRFRAYYETAESLLTASCQLIGAHKAEFFGRQTLVQVNEKKGICTIPPPTLLDEEAQDRFRCFMRAIDGASIPHRAPVLWQSGEDCLILVEDGLVDTQGRLLPSLKHRLFDKKWSLTAREEILLELARSLAALHDCQAEYGGGCYHGFLLPRSIYLDLDANHRVNRLVIAHSGLAFAVGAHSLCERLQELKAGAVTIEKYCAREVLEQLAMLAPEQRDSELADKVGPAADFYTFGALAVTLLTQKRFTEPALVDWDKCPRQWRSFLQTCLETIPGRRPKEFLELEDWLSDPELALTHQDEREQEEYEEDETQTETPPQDLECLSQLLAQAKHADAKSIETNESLHKQLERVVKALQSNRWQQALTLLTHLDKRFPGDARIQAYLAVACYESGKLEHAEKFYQAAKELNPQQAKLFRSHVAARM